MPTLRLRDGTTAALSRFADTPYFSFDGHQDAWLHDNDQLHQTGNGNDITVADDEYDAQITRYLAGSLTLARGLPRQHPLYHEVRELGILMPLGVGAMPDRATNATRYLPFGPDLALAQGIALGRAGLGPGDDQRMMADFAALAGSLSPVDVGLTVEMTVGAGVSFYHAGEIQVRGPITHGLTIQNVQLLASDLSLVPDEAATAIYEAEHGGLRHRATVAALAAHGNQALAAVRGDDHARADHAETLFAMRKALVTKCEPILDVILKSTKPTERPGNRDDVNYRHYLDSSVNREAHDEYVAAVAAGADRADASVAAQRRALLWLTRVSIAHETQEPPFPNNWESLG